MFPWRSLEERQAYDEGFWLGLVVVLGSEVCLGLAVLLIWWLSTCPTARCGG